MPPIGRSSAFMRVPTCTHLRLTQANALEEFPNLRCKRIRIVEINRMARVDMNEGCVRPPAGHFFRVCP